MIDQPKIFNKNSFSIDPGLLFINGRWKPASNGQTFDLINPSDESLITTIAASSPDDVNEAVDAARLAFNEGPWKIIKPSERASLLFKIADLIAAHAEELAFCEAVEIGMLFKDSLNINIPHIVNMFRYYGGWATKLEGRQKPVEGWPGEHLYCFTRKEPLGVVAGITPYNFPLILSVSKIAPALAAGNTFIHKPASGAPLSAIKLAKIIEASGIPAGVYNLLTGSGSAIGSILTAHPDIAKIAITGSTETGKQIIKDGADTLKHVTVELGGKSPHIIFSDADLEKAVESAYFALFWNKGEVCVAGSRLLVEDAIYDDFIARLTERLSKVKVGDPFDPLADYGPMSGKSAYDKVNSYISIGKQEGAKIITGSTERASSEKGYYIRPTIFADATNNMRIAREEIFGPVLPVIRFQGFDEAIRIANDTTYGLASGVQTTDLRKAIKASELLQSGMVWLNTWHHYSPAAPFGGYKQSGYGRENGMEALDYYTQTKTVWMDLNS
ncbi:aldehyde dehydrogenase family protein [Chitinophaga sp. RAB17]|uniref:aldehyde dehydrogenase family protein n=1 Tax=Chitinophaga sp. RAB17 TaxID=3233049 RepID=UPI003F8F0C57